LDSASPLPLSEFVQRRDNLAKALVEDGIDAFIVEPGYTFQYYANVSQPDWVSGNQFPIFSITALETPLSHSSPFNLVILEIPKGGKC
jgi:Xaa-Pro aminopeptidase